MLQFFIAAFIAAFILFYFTCAAGLSVIAAKVSITVNNSAADCPISLKFGIHSLITWHPMYCTCSRLRGRRSKLQRDITYKQFKKSGMDRLTEFKFGENYLRAECNIWHVIKSNIKSLSTADCSVSLTFGAEFEHVTVDRLWTFKVKGSKVKVAA